MQHRYTRYINRRCTNCSLMSSASTCVDCTANHWLGSLPSISAKYFPIAQLKCPYEIEVQSAYQLQRVLNELVNIYGMKPKRRIGSIYKIRSLFHTCQTRSQLLYQRPFPGWGRPTPRSLVRTTIRFHLVERLHSLGVHMPNLHSDGS